VGPQLLTGRTANPFPLYTASLYMQLQTHTGLIAVGFADDLSLLAFGNDNQETSRYLEGA
jgi:hypothetical protein